MSGGDQVETRQHRVAVERVPGPRQAAPVPVGRHHRQPRRRRQGLRAAPLHPEHRPLGPLYSNGNPASNTSGGDYWYIYKDVLFIDLNSNSYATAAGRRRRRGAHRVRHRRHQPARRRGQVEGARLPPLDLLAGRPRQGRRQQGAARRLPDGVLQPRRRPGAAGPRPQLLPQLPDQERRRRRTRPSSPAPPTCSPARAASST